MPFYSYNTVATQKRSGAYSSNRSAVASTGATFTGQFQPLDPKMAENMGLVGQAYQFICPGGSDIKANDVLTIASVDYHVQGISRYQQAAIDIVKCVLVLSVKV